MIAFLKGKLIDVLPNKLILDVGMLVMKFLFLFPRLKNYPFPARKSPCIRIYRFVKMPMSFTDFSPARRKTCSCSWSTTSQASDPNSPSLF